MQKSQRNRYLIKNTFIFALGDFGTKFISFFLVPLYTNLLTTEQYGTTDFVYTLSTLLMPFLTCNIAEAILRFSMDPDADHDSIFRVSLAFLGFAALACGALIPLSRYLPYISSYGVHTYLYTLSAIFYQLVTCFLRGKEQLMQYSLTNIAHSLAIALWNILFLAVLDRGVEGYLAAYTLANFLCALLGAALGGFHRYLWQLRVDRSLAANMLKYSLALLPTALMWTVSSSAGRILVTAIAGAAANGIFAVAYKVPSILSTLSGIFTRAWTYSAVREKTSTDAEGYTNQIYAPFASILTLSAAGALLLLKPFLMLYVGPEYYIAWQSTSFLILGFVFNSLATFLLAQYTTQKDTRGLLISAAIGAVVNVLLGPPLILLWGAPGAAAAACLGHLCYFAYIAYDTRRYQKVRVLTRHSLFSYVLLGLMTATLFWDAPWGCGLLCLEFLAMVIHYQKFLCAITHGLLRECTTRFRSIR